MVHSKYVAPLLSMLYCKHWYINTHARSYILTTLLNCTLFLKFPRIRAIGSIRFELIYIAELMLKQFIVLKNHNDLNNEKVDGSIASKRAHTYILVLKL